MHIILLALVLGGVFVAGLGVFCVYKNRTSNVVNTAGGFINSFFEPGRSQTSEGQDAETVSTQLTRVIEKQPLKIKEDYGAIAEYLDVTKREAADIADTIEAQTEALLEEQREPMAIPDDQLRPDPEATLHTASFEEREHHIKVYSNREMSMK